MGKKKMMSDDLNMMNPGGKPPSKKQFKEVLGY